MWKYLEYVRNSGVNSSLFNHLEQHFLASLTRHIKLSWVPQLGQLQWPQQNAYALAEEMDCCQPASMAVAASPYTERVCENECGTPYVMPHIFAWHQFSFFSCSGVSLWNSCSLLSPLRTRQVFLGLKHWYAPFSAMWDCRFRTEAAGACVPPGQGDPHSSVAQGVAEGAVAAAPIAQLHPAPKPPAMGREH